MTIYYRDPEVQVTSAGIQVGKRWFPLAELRYVWHLRHRRPIRHGWMLAASGALFLLMALPVAVCAGWGFSFLRDQPVAGRASGAVIVVVVLVAVAAIVGRAAIELPLGLLDRIHLRGTANHEIRAAWHGTEVVVFDTDDAHRFGKVYRALQRAIESHG